MARDIDIFGFFLLGFTLLGGYTYLQLKRDGLLSGNLFMSLIPVGLIIILPMFITHLSPVMAMRYLDNYLEKNETKIESGFYSFRDYYVVSKQFEQAARQEKAIKAKAPGALESQIIVDLYANGRVDEAFDYSLRLVDRFPYRADYRMQKGNLLKHYKRYKDAEDELIMAVRLDKYNPEMYHYLSELYRETGRETDCIKAIRQAINIDPKDILALVDLAGYYFRMGKLNSLDSTIQVIIDLNPEEPYAYMYNGLAAEQKQQYQKALKNYEKFIESPTDFPEKAIIRRRMDNIISKTGDSSAVE